MDLKKENEQHPAIKETLDAVKANIDMLMNIKGTVSPDHLHRELGKIMWNYVGMARDAEGLKKAITEIQALREEFKTNLKIVGDKTELNDQLERAGRLQDFLELGELMARDALERNESCGGHFRTEYQTPEGEALRNDDAFMYAAAWQYTGEGQPEELVKEDLKFEFVHPSQRSYK